MVDVPHLLFAAAPGPLEPQQVRLPQRGCRATRRARRPGHHAHGKQEIVGFQRELGTWQRCLSEYSWWNHC